MTITHIPELGNVPNLPGANCVSLGDPDFFFPESTNITLEHKSLIERICMRCPVQVECLQFALENDERHGYWGGFSPADRDRMSPPGTRVAFATGHAIMRDMRIMGIGLEEACRIHGIKVASFKTWQHRQATKYKTTTNERKSK